MSGGSAPKRKAYTHEKELVDQATSSGIKAERAWGSNGAAMGEHPEVDVVIGGYKGQAKRRKSIATYIQPSEHVDVVFVREDRGEQLVVMRYFDWLDLVKDSDSHPVTNRT